MSALRKRPNRRNYQIDAVMDDLAAFHTQCRKVLKRTKGGMSSSLSSSSSPTASTLPMPVNPPPMPPPNAPPPKFWKFCMPYRCEWEALHRMYMVS